MQTVDIDKRDEQNGEYPRMFRYPCGCVGFSPLNERTEGDSRMPIADALIVYDCADDADEVNPCFYIRRGIYMLQAHRSGAEMTPIPLTHEEVLKHIKSIRNMMTNGKRFVALQSLLKSESS